MLSSACYAINDQHSAEVDTPIIYAQGNDKLSVPVRIHIVTSQISTDLNAEISRSETENVFNIVNLIWQQAGIHFEIESVVNLKAANEDQYVAASKRNSKLDTAQKMKVMKQVCNIPNQSKGVLNLCVVGKMSNGSGGVFFKGSKPKVVWPIVLRSGKKPLNPATLAHEFGHFLGLPHNIENDIFLMRGKGNNMRRDKLFNMIRLTENEIIRARKMATRFSKI